MPKKVVSDSWVMANVRNVKKSVTFYSKLGLKPTINRPYYAEIKCPGGTVLGLHLLHKKERTKKADRGWGIMLRVKNLKKVVADLKRKRVPCGKIKRAPGGADFSHLFDPDGNKLVLLQM